MKGLRRKGIEIVLAAGMTALALAVGCSGKDAKQEVVATVNGEEIRVSDVRIWLGAPAEMVAMTDIPMNKKNKALDQLITGRLLAQEARSMGLDNTPEFRESLRRNEPWTRSNALLRKEIGAKIRLDDDDKEIQAEVVRLKEKKSGISDADASARAKRSLAGIRIRKLQADLTATAKKETGATVDQEALSAYAGKQGIEGSEWYKRTREDIERNILRTMAMEKVLREEVVVTEKEIDAAYAQRSKELGGSGRKMSRSAAREQIRGLLQNEKHRERLDAYIEGLRKKAKITVNDAALPKV